MSKGTPEKIVILGGGMASLTAAFELTSQPNWQERYDISIYQMGWRLGGKGASGRNPQHHDRIEEHGLHVWLGFYHQAFRLIRACYAENDRQPDQPLARFEDAFIRCHRLAGVEYIKGERLPWHVNFPDAPGLPGDAETNTKPSIWVILRRVYAFMKDLDREGYGILAGGHTSRKRSSHHRFAKLKMKLRLASVAALETLPSLLHWLGKSKPTHPQFSSGAIHKLLERCRHDAWESVKDCIETDTKARRSWIMLDFFLATVKGLHSEGIRDFDSMTALDRYDFREFLAAHGASEVTLQSPAICGFYNLGFAYLGGKKDQPSLAAGVMMRFSLQMFFNYRGAMFWKMTSGMGDVVFAPLYEVLRKRGVTFHFFRRVTALNLDQNQASIQTVSLEKQVNLHSDAEYEPLLEVNGMPCWPSHPLYEQIEHGDALQQSNQDLESDWQSWPPVGSQKLERGRDFDRVILGISLAALPAITAELMAAHQPFHDMVAKIPHVATCAAQLWLKPNLEALGWDPTSSLFDGEGEAMNTWSDMTHLLEVESWPDAQVGHLAYFCGAMEDLEQPTGPNDSEFPRRMASHAHARGQALLASLGHIWPGGVKQEGAGALDPSVLVGDPVADQFYKANCHLSDRYNLAAKGTTQYRLKAAESGFANLVLAGDWTDNGLNYGCIEAATRSGIQAAQAILKGHSSSLPNSNS